MQQWKNIFMLEEKLGFMCYNGEEIKERGWKMGRKRCIIRKTPSRGWRKTAIFCAIGALTALLIRLIFFQNSEIMWQDAALEAASEGLTDYRVELRLIPEESVLAISESICYCNSTGDTLGSLMLRTWLNAFQSEETSPAATEELYDACYPEGFSPGGLTVYNVEWNGQAAEHSFVNADETALRIDIPELEPGESGTLFFRCLAKIPHCAFRTGYTEGCWQLGNTLPLLSVYADGEWRTDTYYAIGDPFVNECANFHITLEAPEGYLPACSVPLEKEKDGLWRGELLAARDAALCVYEHAAIAKGQAGNTRILSYAETAAEARRALDDAKKALETFSELYGEYPYPALSVCEVSFPFSGMEYSALCMIGNGQYAEDKVDSLELTVAHETAHQWFYALIGSDGVNQPWQDEALAEYAMLRYVGKRYGQSSFETLRYYRVDSAMMENVPGSPTPGSPISYYNNYQDYRTVVYGRGAALLLALDEFLPGGTDAFLRAYVKEFAFQFVTREQFESFLNSYSGLDAGPLLLDYLDTMT